MRKSTPLYVVLAVTTAASIYLGVQWRAAQGANRELQARVEMLERRPVPRAVPVSVEAHAETPAASARVANLNLPSEVTAPAARPDNFRDSQQRLLKNPDYRRALLSRHRLTIETEYRDLPRFLNLSPEMTARLFDLMAEHEVEKIELQAGWPANRQADKSLQTMIAELRAQNDAQLSQLIGERNLTQLKDYSSNLESRLEVDALRADLARTSEPLREDQVEPMIALVSAENQRADQEQRDRGGIEAALPPGFSSPNPDLAIAANNRIVAAAAMVLSSTQLETVKDFYRRQRIQMETQRDLGRLQAEAFTRKSN